MLPAVLLIAAALAADPCAQLRLTLSTDLGVALQGLPWAPDLRLSLGPPILSTDDLRTRIDTAFAGSTAVPLTNVVYNNNTGKPVLDKKGNTRREALTGVSSIQKDASGVLRIRSMLQIDADGATDSTTIDPDHGQVDTSLKWLDDKGKAHAMDTRTVPFFVLPLGLYQGLGVQLGDVAAVIYQDRVEYGIFADVGPWQKLGEGSIALHDNLGNNPWTRSGKPWNGIEGTDAVTMVVFPGSRDQVFPLPAGKTFDASRVHNAPDQAKIREVGEQLLEVHVWGDMAFKPMTTVHHAGS